MGDPAGGRRARPAARPGACLAGGLALAPALALACSVPAAAVPAAGEADRPPPSIVAPGFLGSPDILADDLGAIVRVLASDELQGRETGSPGGLTAAFFLADRLHAWGLQPAGDGAGEAERGSLAFLQAIGVEGFPMPSVPRLVAFAAPADGGGAGGLGTEGPAGGPTAPEAVLEAVFGADFEYEGGGALDGRFDLVVVGDDGQAAAAEPRPDAALYLHGPPGARRRWLEAMGAPEGRGWGLLLLPGRPTPGEARTAPPHGLRASGAPAPPPALRVRGPLRERIAAGEVRAVAAAIEAGAATHAFNVVGRIAGVGAPGRPGLADEAVVITAHHDHIGTRAPTGAAGEDLVYNGADDDASGVAAVLELAHAFAAGAPPARTLVFLLVTGEEHGLLGSTHYLDHPAVPLERTVFNLNFEMVGRPDAAAGGPGRLWLTGFERTTLGPALAERGLPVVADPHPEQRFFERSDNMVFVMRGVPGQTLSSYGLHDDYHGVGDEAHALDLDHMQAAVRTALQVARAIADGEIDPEWLPGGDPLAPAPAEHPSR